MPLNGSRRLLDDALWGRVIGHMIQERDTKLPPYYPGLLMFPDPSAGWISGYVDISFWAVFLYPLSSLVYVIGAGIVLYYSYHPSSQYNDDADLAKHPSTTLYVVAAVIMIINVFLCFWDLYLQRKGSSVSSLNSTVQVENDEIVLVAETSNADSMMYFFNNIFFLGGAIIYLIDAIWKQNSKTDIQKCSLSIWCGTFWILFWAAFCFRTYLIFFILILCS